MHTHVDAFPRQSRCVPTLPFNGAVLAQLSDAYPERLKALLGVDATAPAALPPDVLVRAVIAWTQLFGMISFELFGQFVGSFEPADAFFGHAAQQLAAFVGLR